MKFLHMQVFFTGKELEVTPENMLEVFAENQIWGCRIYHVTEEEYESLKNGWGVNKPKNPVYDYVTDCGTPSSDGEEERRDIGLFCPELVGNTLTLSYPYPVKNGYTRSYAFLFEGNDGGPFVDRYDRSRYQIERNECEIIDHSIHINDIRDIAKFCNCGELFTTETIESIAKAMMKNCKKISYVPCSTAIGFLLHDTPKDLEYREKVDKHLCKTFKNREFKPRRTLTLQKKEAYQMVDEYEAHLFNVEEEKELKS